MDKSFLCDKTLTKELINFFHFYSKIIGKNTTYEITLKEDRKYHLKWSFLKNQTVEEIKKYWVEQEVKDTSEFETFGKVGTIGINNVEYLTFKSNAVVANSGTVYHYWYTWRI